MLNALATQDEIGSFKNTLELLAANLNFHVNSSLSKAHGIHLFRGYVDANGNDFRVYQDSFGNNLSGSNTSQANQVRFVVNGVPYYAPNIHADPGAQPAGTGAISITSETVDGPTDSSLITDYVTDEAVGAANANALFLSHTLLLHQFAHIPMTVINNPVISGIGSVIGRFRLRMQFNGIIYEIPCDTMPGGPPQPPRIQMIPNSFYFESPACGGSDLNYVFIPTVVGGTRPMNFTWQYFDATVGHYLSLPSGNPGSLTDVPFVNHPSSGIPTQKESTSTGQIHFFNGAPGGNNFDYILVKLTVTNSAGTTTTDPANNPLIFSVQVQDHAPCCWFCTQSNISKRIAHNDWRAIGTIEQELFRRCRRMVVWYVRDGNVLVDKMLAQGVTQMWFEQFTAELLKLFYADGLSAAAAYYLRQVGDMTEKYWPQCAHRGYKAGLDYRRLLDLHSEECNINMPAVS